MFQGIHSFEEFTSKVNSLAQRMLIHEAQKQLKFKVLEDINKIFEHNERKKREEMQETSKDMETSPNVSKSDE